MTQNLVAYSAIVVKNEGGFVMKKIKNFLLNNMNTVMSIFALAFAVGSSQRICYYIFHQPKMPEDVMNMNKK